MRVHRVHVALLAVGVVCVTVVGVGLAVVTYRWMVPHPTPSTAPTLTTSVGFTPPLPTVTRRVGIPLPPTSQAVPPTTTARDVELMGVLAQEINANCGGLGHVAAAAWAERQWALVCQQPNGYRLAVTFGDHYTTTGVTPAADGQRCTFHTQLGRTQLVFTPDTLRVGDRPTAFAHGVCRAGA